MNTAQSVFVGLALAVLSSSAAKAGEDTKDLKDARRAIMAFAKTPAPGWVKKSGWAEEKDGDTYYFGVGRFELKRPLRKERSARMVRLFVKTAENRARTAVQKAYAKAATGKSESAHTLPDVVVVERYLTPDHKTLYALARWKYDEASLKKGSELDQMVAEWAKRADNPPKKCRLEPWEPSAADYRARGKISGCLIASMGAELSTGKKRRSWTRKTTPWTSTHKKFPREVTFAVGSAKAPETTSPKFQDAWQTAFEAASKQLPRPCHEQATLDFFLGEGKVFLLRGCISVYK